MNSAELQEKKFENEQVSVVVHRKPGSRVEFVIHAMPEVVRKAHLEAVKAVAKEVSLPGFRKGRAPGELVEKRFPKEIDRQCQDSIANYVLREAEKLTQISPINRSARVTFNMHQYNLTDGADLSLSFETDPVLPVIDPKAIELQKIERPLVNDEKIEETIRQTRFFFAEWKHCDDRPIEHDDCVVLDVENIETTPPQKVFRDVRFEVTKKGMANWMYDLVMGRLKGEEIEGVSTPDAELSDDEKSAFKPQRVRVTVKAIERAELPPLDDTFAKKVGVDTVEALRQHISLILERQADAHVREKLREQVSQQILEKYPLEIPFTVIEKETNFRMQHLLKDNVFFQHWSKMSEPERRRTVQSVFEQSQKAVRMYYLCRKISEDAHIQIQPQDVPSAPSSTLETLLQPPSHYNVSDQQEMQQAEAFSRLLLEKAEDYIIAHATFKS